MEGGFIRTLKALEKLPEGFEGTYDSDAIECIDQQSKRCKHTAYHVLSWISYAFRPLSLTELRYALAVREEIVKWNENDPLDDLDAHPVVTHMVRDDRDIR